MFIARCRTNLRRGSDERTDATDFELSIRPLVRTAMSGVGPVIYKHYTPTGVSDLSEANVGQNK